VAAIQAAVSPCLWHIFQKMARPVIMPMVLKNSAAILDNMQSVEA
jgi:hypothetical protein